MQCLLWDLGTVEAFNEQGWGRLGWGDNDWGEAGSSVQASPTGIAMTAAIAAPQSVTGDASCNCKYFKCSTINFRNC